MDKFDANNTQDNNSKYNNVITNEMQNKIDNDNEISEKKERVLVKTGENTYQIKLVPSTGIKKTFKLSGSSAPIDNLSILFSMDTFYDFTKKEVMEKFFNHRFNFDPIFEHLDKVMSVLISNEVNEISYDKCPIIVPEIEFDADDLKLTPKPEAQRYRGVELVCNRRIMFENLAEYKNLTRNRYRHSTKEVEEAKLKINEKIFNLIINGGFSGMEMLSYYKILVTKEE